ncbi:MAG: M16 family metallopeptidase [Candidatus Aminicenantia bacterium]
MKILRIVVILFLIGGNYLFCQLNFPLNHFILNNGLNIVFLEERTFPVITLAIVYHTGSRDDPVGKTGMAQLMQSIMFSGTDNIPPMAHLAMIKRYGGDVNAFVTEDYIIFYQSFPSSQLKTALWLEAERMKGLRIDMSFFERQKEILKEELKKRLETDPFASGFLKLNEIAFINFPYAHPVTGYIEDIENIELDDMKNYYSNYFTPSNAWTILVGDFDADTTISMIKELFERIPTRKVKSANLPSEGYRRGELRMKTFKKGIYNHAVHVAYPIPPRASPEFYVLKVIEYLLLHERNSLLPKELIFNRNLAQQITGEAEEREGSSLFTFFIMGRPGITAEMLGAHFTYEIEKFVKSVPSSWELARAKNNLKRDYLENLGTPWGKALLLSKLCIYNGSPHLLNMELNRFMKVNQFDVYKVANKYFNKDNGVFIYVIPQW